MIKKHEFRRRIVRNKYNITDKSKVGDEMDVWEKVKIISSILAAIGIPLVIAIIGNFYTKALKERELQGKFVELAVQILNSEPNPETRNIREWAIKIIDRYSGVPLTESAQKDLIESIPLIETKIPEVYGDIKIPDLDSGELRIENDFLVGKGTQYRLSPKTSGELKKSDIKAIIIHYTAGPSMESATKVLTETSMTGSTHLLIGRDGTIFQIVPFNFVSWSAGTGKFKGITNFNRHSIAIMLDNAGPLSKKDSSYFTWFGAEIDPAEVELAAHKHDKAPNYWHKFTEKQIQVTRKVCGILAKEYNVQWILGHDDISLRRRDPGPLFPMKELQVSILGHEID